MSEGVPAWLYDGASAVRREVLVTINDDRIDITGQRPVTLSQLRRIDGRAPVFSRDDLCGWRLGFDDALPPSLRDQLPAADRYGGLIDRIGLWGAAAIGVCLSTLVIAGAIWGADLLARMIPYGWEQRLGDAIDGDFAEYACRVPDGQKALDELAHRLSPSGRPMRVTVVDIPMVNAVALPGGRILLFRGLIDEAQSPDEVAGVLAHEIGHVEHRHVMVGLLRRFGIGLLTGSSGSAGQYGQALIESRYSQAAESEADDYSIERLHAANISPAATAALFARLGRDEAGMPRALNYLASHPPSADRQRLFAAAARAMPAARPALTPAAWSAVRAMCTIAKPKNDPDFHFRF